MLIYGLIGCLKKSEYFCQTPVLGLGLGVDFTFAWDNNNHKNKPHLVLGNEEKRVAIRDKGLRIRDKG